MPDEVPFTKPRPQQLTLAEVRALYKAGRTDEIERARAGGHLEDVMKTGGKRPAPAEVPK
jgi:hypothetical protein